MTLCINDLTEVVKLEIMCASRQGDRCSFTQRAERMLCKAAMVAIKVRVTDLFGVVCQICYRCVTEGRGWHCCFALPPSVNRHPFWMSEPGNCATKTQLGPTNSNGWPVLLQGIPQRTCSHAMFLLPLCWGLRSRWSVVLSECIFIVEGCDPSHCLRGSVVLWG